MISPVQALCFRLLCSAPPCIIAQFSSAQIGEVQTPILFQSPCQATSEPLHNNLPPVEKTQPPTSALVQLPGADGSCDSEAMS